jgi:hypothetical protein
LARILCEFPQKLVACITAVAGLPGVDIHAVALVPAVAGILAAASAPANLGVPILCVVLTFRTVQCDILRRLADYRTVIFPLSDQRNIEHRTGEFEKLSDYRISEQGLDLSEFVNQTHKQLSVARLWSFDILGEKMRKSFVKQII